MINNQKEPEANLLLSNVDIVTIAVYILGGDSDYVDTEDIAVKVNELAPGRFTWRKYANQINIESVRRRLTDAKDIRKGGYLLGSHKDGWILSENGLNFSKKQIKGLKNRNLSRMPMSKKEQIWKNREKARMLESKAYLKFVSKRIEEITKQDSEAFFKINDYVTGEARKRKLTLYLNKFSDDNELYTLIKKLREKVEKNEW